jgi:hypothetical protein
MHVQTLSCFLLGEDNYGGEPVTSAKVKLLNQNSQFEMKNYII